MVLTLFRQLTLDLYSAAALEAVFSNKVQGPEEVLCITTPHGVLVSAPRKRGADIAHVG